MREPIMISCFDKSAVMAMPWALAGYRCYCVDIEHPQTRDPSGETPGPHPNITLVRADMRQWLPPRGRVAFAAFFPPCTHVAVSGAKWFVGKGLGALAESVELFGYAARMAEWLECPYVIENPVTTISTYWRKPDYYFDPNDYGDPYTKKTCLWTGGGFVMPPKDRVEPVEGSKMHLLPPSAERAELRSETPPGFAQAVFEHNANLNGMRPILACDQRDSVEAGL